MASNISYKIVPQDNWEKDRILAWIRDLGRRTRVNSFDWNPPNVPGQSTVDTTLTSTDTGCAALAEIRAGMRILINPPSSILAGLVVAGVWSDTDKTLTVRLANVTAGGLNTGSGTFNYFAFDQ